MRKHRNAQEILSSPVRHSVAVQASGRQRRHRNAQEILSPPVRIAVTAVLAVLVLIPIAYTLLLSVTPDTQIGTGGLIPSQWAFGNYIQMWTTVSLAQGLTNSLIIAGCASVIAVILAVGAAYIITRFKFRGRLPYLYSLIGLQTVPSVMLLLPLFVLYASIQAAIHLQIVGTYPAVVITYLTFALPFATWLMVSYLGSIPIDLEEAALCDGATRLQTLRLIIVPLALPGMVVALVFAFLTGWNDVLFASVLTSPETRTLAVQLQAFSSSQEGGALPLYGQLMGAAVVSAIPVVILYMVFQRYLIGGLTAGGVKG
jgi:ABC-type glycerol-3-phosphate transport system permease component